MNNRTQVRNVLRKTRDLYDDSREVAQNGATHAKNFINRKPMLSTLLGLGLGVLIGHWLRPRD